jgi:hypothetical protein
MIHRGARSQNPGVRMKMKSLRSVVEQELRLMAVR